MKRLAILLTSLLLLSQFGSAQEGSRLRKDLAENRKRIASVKKKLEEANRREREIADKLADTRKRMVKAEDDLAKTEKELDTAEEKLRKLKMRVRRTSIRLLRAQTALEARLREIYMEGEVSYLAVLLQSELSGRCVVIRALARAVLCLVLC